MIIDKVVFIKFMLLVSDFAFGQVIEALHCKTELN